jgi:hypothetical protein
MVRLFDAALEATEAVQSGVLDPARWAFYDDLADEPMAGARTPRGDSASEASQVWSRYAEYNRAAREDTGPEVSRAWLAWEEYTRAGGNMCNVPPAWREHVNSAWAYAALRKTAAALRAAEAAQDALRAEAEQLRGNASEELSGVASDASLESRAWAAAEETCSLRRSLHAQCEELRAMHDRYAYLRGRLPRPLVPRATQDIPSPSPSGADE